MGSTAAGCAMTAAVAAAAAVATTTTIATTTATATGAATTATLATTIINGIDGAASTFFGAGLGLEAKAAFDLGFDFRGSNIYAAEGGDALGEAELFEAGEDGFDDITFIG